MRKIHLAKPLYFQRERLFSILKAFCGPFYPKTKTKQFCYTPLYIVLSNPLGAPLFAKNSDCSPKGESDCGKSGKKFGNVIPNVLLPMAVDYHIRSREVDVNDIATDELSNLNGEAESKNQSIRVRFTFSLLRLSFWFFFLCPIIM